MPPYWPWSQVLRASGLPTAELGEAGWLLQPASGPADSMSAAAAADAQFRLFEAVSRCLGRLAADGPVLVVLDDLHWADEPSLRLLRFLARALTARVVLLGAYRDTEAPPELRELAGEAQQLALAGLALGEVGTLARELVGEEVPDQVTAELWRRSGGNPFFIRELTRLLLAQGSWSQQAQIPASVAETLRRRLARLSTECVRLLEWAAVAGRDIDLSLLVQDAVPAGEAAAGSLLDEARRAGVITGSSFSHDLYRETILDGLSQADRAVLNLSVGKALQGRPGPAARIAGHLVAAGAQARPDALRYSLLAAREATARLGHEDACAHYLRALQITEELGPVGQRTEILLQLAASYDRAGEARPGRAALAAGHPGQPGGLRCRRARGGGARHADARAQIWRAERRAARPAARGCAAAGGGRGAAGPAVPGAGGAGPHAAARAGTGCPGRRRSGPRNKPWSWLPPRTTPAPWPRPSSPSTTRCGLLAPRPRRLPVIAEMLEAAQSCGDADLVAEAHLLRAAGLLELGDPDGRGELLNYVELAENLGHARGRWAALTRRATFAQLARPAQESALLGEQALELGLAIGEQDAIGCYCTSRYALVALGVREPPTGMRPFRPALVGVPAPAGLASRRPRRRGRGRRRPGRASVCSTSRYGRVSKDSPRRPWSSPWRAPTPSGGGSASRLLPHAGTHVVVGGRASYHAAVDHHLGALAASLGETAAAEEHFRAALALHERLGADGLGPAVRAGPPPGSRGSPAAAEANEFRLVNGVRLLCFGGQHAQLPDTKGLADVAVLIGARGADVHVLTLVGSELPRTGADPVLDEQAKAAYKLRLDRLAGEIDAADAAGRAERAEELHAERAALIRELAAAAGLGGRRPQARR